MFEAVASSNLSGSTNAPIQTARTVYFRDAGFGANQFEILILHPGDPNASVQVTDLEIMSNSAFARNPGIAANQIDLAQAWVILGSDGVTPVYQFQLLPDAANIQPQPNFLAVPGQGGNIGGICNVPGLGNLCGEFGQNPLLQSAYVVARTGSGWFYFPPTGGIYGELSLQGSSIDNANVQGFYQGRFSGQSAGNFAC